MMIRQLMHRLRTRSPAAAPHGFIERCACCGGTEFENQGVLWAKLIREWRLSPSEAAYIDRQQGTACLGCRSSLRSIALATSMMRYFGFTGTFDAWVRSPVAGRLAVLELNGAGNLTPFLRQLPGHVEKSYPEVDMLAMPFADSTFDLVVHSDTLEHVPDPVRGLSECHRVLRSGGACCFTVPVVVGRMSRSRTGLRPSFHGAPHANMADFRVETEYGADAWGHVIAAGFSEVRILAAEYPSALAFTAVR
jgi:SAM-dependent methyltransferase